MACYREGNTVATAQPARNCRAKRIKVSDIVLFGSAGDWAYRSRVLAIVSLKLFCLASGKSKFVIGFEPSGIDVPRGEHGLRADIPDKLWCMASIITSAV